MRKVSLLMVGAVVLTMGASAEAQTRLAATCNQATPEPNYTLPAGDAAGHTITLAKVKCTYTKGELAGVAVKVEEDVYTSDTSGKTSHDQGYGVGTLASGDKYFLRWQGTTAMEKEAPVSATCTWTFTGGTGKLKGLTGKGTCSGKFDPTGAAVFNIQGVYQLPAAKGQ